MRVAPEGWPFIYIGLFLEGMLALIGWAFGGWLIVLPALFSLIVVWLFVFFRDPTRQGPRGDGLVISPADGKVISIAQVEEAMYLHKKATRVSIFMNVFNVHVNRYPVTGEIEIVHYNPGEFMVASHEKASLVNEQSSVGIKPEKGPQVLVRQIAGSIARRIVTDGNPGEIARQGERMGMIRFGSRVDLFLDPSASVKVELGQKVSAGLTVIAEVGK
jgi:phosphatidylserine decarboxylase